MNTYFSKISIITNPKLLHYSILLCCLFALMFTTSAQQQSRLKTKNNSIYQRGTIDQYNLVLKNSNNVSLGDNQIIYVAGATVGYDSGLDGLYMSDGSPAIYSLAGTESVIIQARPPFVNTDTFPLYFTTDTADTYTISVAQLQGVFTGNQSIYLRDNSNNTIHDLKLGAYSFSSDEGLFTTRFDILYQNILAVNAIPFNEKEITILKNNNTFYISTGNTSMDNVKIFDIRGSLLLEKSGINSPQLTIENGFSNEILIFQITSNENIQVVKKFVNQ